MKLKKSTDLGNIKRGKRPLNIRLKSQAGAVEIVAGSRRLARKEAYKKVWPRCDLNEEERTVKEISTEQRRKQCTTVKSMRLWK